MTVTDLHSKVHSMKTEVPASACGYCGSRIERSKVLSVTGCCIVLSYTFLTLFTVKPPAVCGGFPAGSVERTVWDQISFPR